MSTVYVVLATQPPNFRPIVAKGKKLFFPFLYIGFIIEKLKIIGTGGFARKCYVIVPLQHLVILHRKPSDAHTGCHLT